MSQVKTLVSAKAVSVQQIIKTANTVPGELVQAEFFTIPEGLLELKNRQPKNGGDRSCNVHLGKLHETDKRLIRQGQ